MKTLPLVLAFFSLLLPITVCAQAPQRLTVNVTNTANEPIPNAQVFLILESGAYQEAKLENGAYVCEPTGQCAKIFVGAPGHEASSTKVPNGAAGAISVKLTPSTTKSSAVMKSGWGKIPGIDGDVSPLYDHLKRTYLFTKGIGLFDNGKPANQPLKIELKKSIRAETPTGNKFTIWVMDITQQVSLLEYTMPES